MRCARPFCIALELGGAAGWSEAAQRSGPNLPTLLNFGPTQATAVADSTEVDFDARSGLGRVQQDISEIDRVGPESAPASAKLGPTLVGAKQSLAKLGQT